MEFSSPSPSDSDDTINATATPDLSTELERAQAAYKEASCSTNASFMVTWMLHSTTRDTANAHGKNMISLHAQMIAHRDALVLLESQLDQAERQLDDIQQLMTGPIHPDQRLLSISRLGTKLRTFSQELQRMRSKIAHANFNSDIVQAVDAARSIAAWLSFCKPAVDANDKLCGDHCHNLLDLAANESTDPDIYHQELHHFISKHEKQITLDSELQKGTLDVLQNALTLFSESTSASRSRVFMVLRLGELILRLQNMPDMPTDQRTESIKMVNESLGKLGDLKGAIAQGMARAIQQLADRSAANLDQSATGNIMEAAKRLATILDTQPCRHVTHRFFVDHGCIYAVDWDGCLTTLRPKHDFVVVFVNASLVELRIESFQLVREIKRWEQRWFQDHLYEACADALLKQFNILI